MAEDQKFNLIDRSKFRCYILIKDKFHVMGTRAADGTLAYGTTQEEKNSITQLNSFKSAKAGSLSLPITVEYDDKDVVSKTLLINTVRQNINKTYNTLLVYEFLTVKGQPTQYIAQNFDAIITVESLGGAGQANNNLVFTIGNAGEVKLGYVDTAQAMRAAGKYDPATDTYTEDAFVEDDDVEIENDPETEAELLSERDDD